MPVLLDHLSAILIGSTTLLILLALQVRTQEEQFDRTTVEMGWRVSQGFALQVEEDFVNLGAGTRSDEDAMTAFGDSTIAFRRKVVPKGATAAQIEALPVVEVTYDVSRTGTLADADGSAPLYTVTRTQSDVPGGSASATLLDYGVGLVRRDGAATTDPGEAVGVRVRYTLTRGTRTRDATRNRVVYDRTFYPAALDR